MRDTVIIQDFITGMYKVIDTIKGKSITIYNASSAKDLQNYIKEKGL